MCYFRAFPSFNFLAFDVNCDVPEQALVFVSRGPFTTSRKSSMHGAAAADDHVSIHWAASTESMFEDDAL